MNNFFKVNLMTSLIALTSIITSHMAIADQQLILSNKCYSAYQLEQKLTLSLVLDDTTQQQNIHLNMNIHTRAVETSRQFLFKIKKQNKYPAENVRSYVMLLEPKISKVNGVAQDFIERYQHPFLVNVDYATGELIELDSTASEKQVIKEYLGYFDLFQYSKNDGNYRYRNGNGHYNAHMEHSKGENYKLSKINKGYLDSNKLRIKRSETLIELEQSGAKNHCFYQSASATEMFINTITKGAYVKGNASINIAISNKTKLPAEHFFHSLTSDISLWPGFNQEARLTQWQAFERLPALFSQLELLVDDKKAFLALFKSEKALWPFMADFMTQENSNSKLINRVVWSLNRINSTESISALLKISMSELANKNVYRSILAMITSSAEINQQGIDELKSYLSEIKYSEENSSEALLLLRSLGALAKQRSQHSPMQSLEIRQYLYSHVIGASNQFKSSLYQSIGALGKSIDREGVEVLLQGLSENQLEVKDSVINALTKIPYQKSYSDLYVAELESELHSATKEKLIRLLGKADKDDVLVKGKLLNIIKEPNTISHKKNSIDSLNRVGFTFNDSEIKILESRLRKETDKSSQRKLARLILKYRNSK